MWLESNCVVIWPRGISFGNNLTIVLLSYFIEVNGKKRMCTSLKDLAFCKRHPCLPNQMLLSIVFCCHIAGT